MKKNSNSCADENENAPTTKPASEDLNMSAGAEMLIARMKTNPEDFEYGGKFYRVVQALNDGQQWVSKRDRIALRDAYDANIVEGAFAEWVYGEIFNPKEPEPLQNLYARAQMQGQKAQIQSQMAQQGMRAAGGTWTDPSAIYGNAIQNNLSSSPGSWTVAASNTSVATHVSDSMLTQIKNKLGL